MADLFEFPEVKLDRDQVTLWRTPQPTRRESDYRRLAKAWGIRSRPVEGGTRISFRDGRGILELFHASDSIWWARGDDVIPEATEPARFADDKEAMQLAQAYLRERGLYDDRAVPVSVTYTQVLRADGPKAKATSIPAAQHVNFEFGLEDLPLFGPGAKMQVTFDGRDVVNAYRFWREPVKDRVREVVPPERAMQLLREDYAFADLNAEECRVVFHRARLGYYALPPREAQGFLFPAYAFDGTVSTPALERYDFTRYVVAIPFSDEEAKEVRSVGHRPTLVFS